MLKIHWGKSKTYIVKVEILVGIIVCVLKSFEECTCLQQFHFTANSCTGSENYFYFCLHRN